MKKEEPKKKNYLGISIVIGVLVILVLSITASLFIQKKEINYNTPIIILSHPSCGHCVELDKNLNLLGDRIKYVETINIVENPEYIPLYHVTGTPKIVCKKTMQVFEGTSGETWENIVKNDLVSFIDDCVKKD